MPIGAHYHFQTRLFSEVFRAADAMKGELYGIHDSIHVMMDSPDLTDKGLSQDTTRKMKRTTPHYRLSVAGTTADELHCTLR
jgi:hypothetical protein